VKIKKAILVWLLGITTLIVVASLTLPLLAQPSNCGGNSYALNACRQITFYASRLTPTTNWPSNLNDLDSIDRAYFFGLNQSHWTPDADYWIRTNAFAAATQRQIVVFCDQLYDNVPQPTIWNLFRHNPAHAVGYSDETGGLISRAEFEQLDRHNFASLRTVEQSYSEWSKP
jgi:hypothetical protein